MNLSRYSHLEFQPAGLTISPCKLAMLARLSAPAPPAALSSRWMHSPDDDSVAFAGVLATMFLLLVLGTLSAEIRPTAPQATASIQPACAPLTQCSRASLPSGQRIRTHT